MEQARSGCVVDYFEVAADLFDFKSRVECRVDGFEGFLEFFGELFTESPPSNSPFSSSSSSLPINDLRLSSSESMVADEPAAAVDAALELAIMPLVSDRPDGADVAGDELLLVVCRVPLADAARVEAAVVAAVFFDWPLVAVLVVEVNTFEKLANPFIRLALLRNGLEARLKLPKASGL